MTDHAEIRRATLADVPALSELGAATFIDAFGDLYAPSDLEAFLADYHCPAYYEEFISDPETASWVVEGRDGALIGYATAGACSLPAPDMAAGSGELQRIYLLRAAQGQGLGKALMNTVLDWLESQFEHLYVGVYSENFRAQKLYRSYGFEKVAEYDFMVGEHADHEWIMQKGAPKA